MTRRQIPSLSVAKNLSRKQQIARTAMQIISEDGLHKLVLVELAKRMGVTDAALYKHFRSKNDILLFMIDEIDAVMREEMGEFIEPRDSYVEKLHELLSFQLDFIDRNKGIPRIMFSECLRQQNVSIAQKLSKLLHGRRTVVTGLLKAAIREGEIDAKIDTEAAADIFMGMMQSTVLFWSLAEFTYSLRAREATLWEEYRKILR